MNQHSVAALGRSWDTAARAAGRELLTSAITRALESLPDPGVWAIGDGATALWMLASGETLFTVHAREDGHVRTTSRPLQADQLLVTLEWGDVQSTDAGEAVWETRWTFRYLGERELHEGWQQITGSVRRSQIDGRETLARAIAALAGWQMNRP